MMAKIRFRSSNSIQQQRRLRLSAGRMISLKKGKETVKGGEGEERCPSSLSLGWNDLFGNNLQTNVRSVAHQTLISPLVVDLLTYLTSSSATKKAGTNAKTDMRQKWWMTS